MHKHALSAIAVLALFILAAGCTAPIGKPLPQNATATIAGLASAPEKYLNSTVTVEGTLASRGDYFGGDVAFFLEDGWSSMRVTSWAPLEAMNCPPQVQPCKPPSTMSSYLNQKVKVTGKLERHMEHAYNKENKSWAAYPNGYQIAVSSAVIVP